MSTHLLLVRRGNELLGTGTAWFLRPDRVLTATRVVGPPGGRGWWADEHGEVLHELVLPEGPLLLEPVTRDQRAGLALLQPVGAAPEVPALPLAETSPQPGARWSTTAQDRLPIQRMRAVGDVSGNDPPYTIEKICKSVWQSRTARLGHTGKQTGQTRQARFPRKRTEQLGGIADSLRNLIKLTRRNVEQGMLVEKGRNAG